MTRDLWDKGGETLEMLYDALGAVASQLEDVEPPTAPPHPKEVYERMAEDLKKWGFIVPITVVKGTEKDAQRIGFILVRHRHRQAEAIRKAQRVILGLMKERQQAQWGEAIY